MSISFSTDVKSIHTTIDLTNSHARELLIYLGLPPASEGHLKATDMLRLCDAAQNKPDRGRGVTQQGCVIDLGRPADYLPSQVRKLRALADRAAQSSPRALIVWY